MKNANILALEKLGYTNVIIDHGAPRSDMSNVIADQEISITYDELVTAATIEIKWNIVRVRRNQLLKDSDWCSGIDIPAHIKEVMLPYRQELRDITNTFLHPDDVVFPNLPEI